MRAEDTDFLIEAALREDLPKGDITSESIIPSGSTSQAVIKAKEIGVVAGIEVAGRVFEKVDPSVTFEPLTEDGHIINPEDDLARVEGPSISLLKAERTALNFLQRLSGIATMTSHYVKALTGRRTKILDTRKTTPGWRMLEKYAVRMGGGENHRMSLSDMVLIKDNHIKLVGGITGAVELARSRVDKEIKVEVEAKNLQEVREALESGADMIMLDNMSEDDIKECVSLAQGRVPLEVSGNITRERIPQISGLGVDFISVGSLTHSFKSLDIGMDFL